MKDDHDKSKILISAPSRQRCLTVSVPMNMVSYSQEATNILYLGYDIDEGGRWTVICISILLQQIGQLVEGDRNTLTQDTPSPLTTSW